MASIYNERDQLTDSQGNLTGNGRYQQMTTAPTAIGRRGNTLIPLQRQTVSSGVVEPAYPTDVVSTSGKSAPKLATNYTSNEDKRENSLRAAMMPVSTMGYRSLMPQEKQGMQNQYDRIASMRGLSSQQRNSFLNAQAKNMAKYGLSPTFDKTSTKGLSQRQIINNELQQQNIALEGAEQAARMQEKAWERAREAKYWRDNYESMLWGV